MTLPLALFGTLRDDALRRVVFGADLVGTPAHLPGWQVASVTGQVYPALIPGDGADVLLVHPNDDAMARAHAFEAVHGYRPQPCVVSTDTGDVEALIYRPDDMPDADGEWSLAEWQSAAGPWMRTASQDIMDRIEMGADPAGLRPYVGAISGRAWSSVIAQQPAALLTRSVPTHSVQVEDRVLSHRGFFGLDTATLRVPRFDGSYSAPLRREVFTGGDAAIVLPYDPDSQRVVLVEQFRMGPWRRQDPQPFVLEPVAGLVDAGETPAEAARREAHEEAGLTLADLIPITATYASPGDSTDFFHCFLGLCPIDDRPPWPGGEPSEGEDIRAHSLPLTTALEMVDSGEINIGVTVMLLLWLDRYRRRQG